MTADPKVYRDPLELAHTLATGWLDSIPVRRVGPTTTVPKVLARVRREIPDGPTDATDVVRELADLADGGLMAIGSGRFFGWVMGGTLPAALAADWLVSAWDQNAGLSYATPAVVAAEDLAGRWLLDLLKLPRNAGVGFTTGATVANFVGIAAGRKHVLDAVGWDLNEHGLSGSPRITVLVGAEAHASVLLALRYLGLGSPVIVESDEEGRLRPDALAKRLDGIDGPVILCLQAGNLHSGAFDPMRESIEIAHRHGAWVHVDGAFGLWAAVSDRYRDTLDGIETADSWATDAHKTLNVPYDCGVAIVADPRILHETFGVHTSYLIRGEDDAVEPGDTVPEMSRRARGVPVWAALTSLGRSGTIALVERLADTARALAEGLAAIPGVEVLNDVVFTQVSLSFGSDELTRRVTARLIDDGTVWMSGSNWRGRDILRISVSNWSTDDADIRSAIDAVADAVTAVSAAPAETR